MLTRYASRELRNIRHMHQLFILSYHARMKYIQIYHNRIYFYYEKVQSESAYAHPKQPLLHLFNKVLEWDFDRCSDNQKVWLIEVLRIRVALYQ